MSPDMGPVGNEGSDMLIKFTVKDYIDGIMREVREGFRSLEAKLDSKADKIIVEAINVRVADLERTRPEPQYTDRLVDEFRTAQKDLADLKINAATKDALDKLMSKMFWLFGLMVTGIIGNAIVNYLQGGGKLPH